MTWRTGGVDNELPTVRRSLAPAMRLASQAEPRLLVVSFLLVVGSWLPDAFGALWLKYLANGVLAHDRQTIFWSAAGLAGAAAPRGAVRPSRGRLSPLLRPPAPTQPGGPPAPPPGA